MSAEPKPAYQNKKYEAALHWWQDLQPSENKRGDRASLAKLRRATPLDAMSHEATFALFNQLGYDRAERWRLARVATLACVLAHVRTNEEKKKFGEAIGRAKFEDKDGEKLKPLRFQRLIASEGEDEIARTFRRAIAILDNNANVCDLAGLILNFDSDATKRKLIFQYYGAGKAAPENSPISDSE